MLTSEHSIVEYRDGLAIPDRLTQATHRHYLDLAARMLAIYETGAGRQRRRLHKQIEAIFADEPDCPVRRVQAFCKLLDDRSVFQADSPGTAARLRLDVFERAARLHPLVQTPDRLFEHEEAESKSQLSAELGRSWDQIEQMLYADVLAYQPLEEFLGYPDPAALLSRYNVAQLQACLYRAESMTITATRDLKTIVRYAKLARLLHEIERLYSSPVDRRSSLEREGTRDDTERRATSDERRTGTYRITFTGPTSVLRETRRYGVNFARFLPALLACSGWEMIAVVQTPWRTRVPLHLSDADQFTSHLPSPEEFDSALEESFAKKFGPERNGWQLIREGDILHERQHTFVPDFTFRHKDGTEVLLEIVGFWTPEYLARRRETLRRFRRHHLLIAVPESSLREGGVVGENVVVYKTALKLEPLLAALEAARRP